MFYYMSHLEIQSTGEIITRSNGNIIEDAKWNMDYDGKNMELETLYNNDYTFVEMNNTELKQLFQALNSSNGQSLHERLQEDFPINKSTIVDTSKRSNKKTKRVKLSQKSRKTPKQNKIKILKSPSTKSKHTRRRKNSGRSVKKRKISTPDIQKTIY